MQLYEAIEEMAKLDFRFKKGDYGLHNNTVYRILYVKSKENKYIAMDCLTEHIYYGVDFTIFDKGSKHLGNNEDIVKLLYTEKFKR